MKRAWWAILAAVAIAGGSGCSLLGPCGAGCNDGGCGSGGCGVLGGDGLGGARGPVASAVGPGGHAHPRMAALRNHMQGSRAGYQPDMGGPSASVAYPYYTTRGPRDWFEPNPPNIGR